MKVLSRLRPAIAVMTLTVLCLVRAPDAKKNDEWWGGMSLEGIMVIGLGYTEKGYPFADDHFLTWGSTIRRDIAAELDFSVDVTKRIRLELDIEGELSKPGLRLNKGYVRFDLPRKQLVRVGNMKRRLGMEQRQSSDELALTTRSLLHAYLESLDCTGYDLSVAYQKKWKMHSGAALKNRLQIALDADGKLFAGTSNRFTPVDSCRLYLDAFYISDIGEQRYETLIGIGGFSYDNDRHRVEIEIAGGRDPHASHLSSLIGEHNNIYFAAARLLLARRVHIGRSWLHSIQPGAGLTYLIPNVDQLSTGLLELRPGVNVYLGRDGCVRWMTDVGAILTDNAVGDQPVHLREYSIATQLQIVWGRSR